MPHWLLPIGWIAPSEELRQSVIALLLASFRRRLAYQAIALRQRLAERSPKKRLFARVECNQDFTIDRRAGQQKRVLRSKE
jgi:hypothetical protein